MVSVRLCLLFLLSISLSNKVLSLYVSESSIRLKIQALETAVQRAGCQQYLAHGYRYEHMYPIDGVALDNTVVSKTNGDLSYFEMHLAIKTIKDGIIILSPTQNPGADDFVFEFAVGIDYGIITVLRLRKEGLIGRDEVARVHTSKLISDAQYTKFYIVIDKDVLTFGKEGDSPIISYSDVRLRHVKYFDMSSYANLDAKFLYDCPPITPVY